MQERQPPINITERRVQNLKLLRNRLWAQLVEVDAEIQRLGHGQQPQDLTPALGRAPQDIFWERRIDFNQTRVEQANMQNDTKL